MAEDASVKYCIVGGGVAGVTAAERIRELDADGSILIIGSEAELLYSRVLLPDYISGKITREKCFLRKEADVETRRITFRRGVTVTAIDTTGKTVTTSDGAHITYERLLIATGGTPRPWSAPGSDQLPVLRMQTIADADAIRALATSRPGVRVAVVGGGFISMEGMEALALAGAQVSLLVREPRMFAGMMPPEAHALLAEVLKEKGVALETNFSVKEIVRDGDAFAVVSEDGRKVPCDALLVGVGIERNISVAQDAGIPVRRGIAVNEHLASSIEGVYAAGDIAEYNDLNFSRPLMMGNWTCSVLMGRVAGENMTGGSAVYQHIPLYSVECFSVKIQMIGIPTSAEGVQNIEQYDAAARTYLSLSLERGILIGAVTMNRGKELGTITKWMKERKDLSGAVEQLSRGASLSDITV